MTTNTAHEQMDKLTSETNVTGENISANDEYDSDDNDAKVKVIEPNRWQWSRITCILISTLFIIIASIVGLYAIYINNNTTVTSTSSQDNEIASYVLPNNTLTVLLHSDTIIKGKYIVNNEIDYNFVSISNKSIEYIEFERISVSNNAHGETWRGFQIYHLNKDEITLKLIHWNKNISHSITITRVQNMSVIETQILESFLGNILCEHFVELSIKLGAMGYLGNMNHAIEDIHRFAQWIWGVVLDNNHIDNSKWIDISDELEKVNEVNLASKTAGYNIETMDELMIYSNKNSGRNLLGNCGIPWDECNNDCLGMCGKGCSCWSRVCGDCECWLGCRDHDRMCCDNGFFSYCCINVLWVRCDGSGSC